MVKLAGYLTPWSRPSLTVPRPSTLTAMPVGATGRLGSRIGDSKGGGPGGGGDGRGRQGQCGRGLPRGGEAALRRAVVHLAGEVGSQGELGGLGGDHIEGAAVGALRPAGEGLIGAGKVALARLGPVNRQHRPVGGAEIQPGHEFIQLLAGAGEHLVVALARALLVEAAP